MTRIQLLTTAEVAERLNVSTKTLARWREQSPTPGPPYTRLGRQIRYHPALVERWLAAQTAMPTAPRETRRRAR